MPRRKAKQDKETVSEGFARECAIQHEDVGPRVGLSAMQSALCASVVEKGTALECVLAESFGGSLKTFLRHLLEVASSRCIKNCKRCSEPTAHPRSIICKGRANNGLGIYVFSYDQRIPNSQWDACTVLCRGLVVVIPIKEETPDGVSLEPQLLLANLDDESCPVRVAECMPKFWEFGEGKGEVSWVDIERSFGSDPASLAVRSILEKVDGNLGLIHPARDCQTLEVQPEEFPLFATKSVGWSKDIVQQRAMLKQQHPDLQLPHGMTSVIVEVVTKAHQVCVPYPIEEFRLLAAIQNGQWLDRQELLALSARWGMALPDSQPVPADSHPATFLQNLLKAAEEYELREGELLAEGVVVELANGLRLKIHNSAWDIINKLWGGEISATTVLPLLLDTRVNSVPLSVIEQSVVGGKDAIVAQKKVEQLRRGVAVAKRTLEEITRELRDALKETASQPLKSIKQHPMFKNITKVRGLLGWVDAIPPETDIEALAIGFPALREMFEGRVKRAEAAAQCDRDVEAVKDVQTKLLKRVLLCLEGIPADSYLEHLEKELGQAVPEEVKELVLGKGRKLDMQRHRLENVLALRT
mmetsp:Transcript_66202/g.137946  ORF Transcript_66202/g.137946 Transcript_66202/m.137946 type:complete len:585 (-) Transcript_66202:182-1936(-)|eukprot:CAMPEP_0181312302 /NCGR_PEP_ID=MMETSP1101-20121128/13622_1 /TAXON_ID=46948 /ORGANISM="Rhodomonas abbreviata, Strain Caron Lab Isolate" /LENGTH=584 /DNA_ID=CAMNT_0023419139 /DNA_START=95 /DNA_END=1849 /DNA_ORIENTATION=+